MKNNKHMKKAAVTVSAIMATSMLSPYITSFADNTIHVGTESKSSTSSESTFLPIIHAQGLKSEKGNVRLLLHYNFKNKDVKELGAVKILNLHASPTSLKGNKLKVDVSYRQVRDGLISVNFDMSHVRVKEFNPNMILEYNIGGKEYNTPIKLDNVKVEQSDVSPQSFATSNNMLPNNSGTVTVNNTEKQYIDSNEPSYLPGTKPISESPVNFSGLISSQDKSVNANSATLNFKFNYRFSSKDSNVYNIKDLQVVNISNYSINSEVKSKQISYGISKDKINEYINNLYNPILTNNVVTTDVNSSTSGSIKFSQVSIDIAPFIGISDNLYAKFSINGVTYSSKLFSGNYPCQLVPNNLTVTVSNSSISTDKDIIKSFIKFNMLDDFDNSLFDYGWGNLKTIKFELNVPKGLKLSFPSTVKDLGGGVYECSSKALKDGQLPVTYTVTDPNVSASFTINASILGCTFGILNFNNFNTVSYTPSTYTLNYSRTTGILGIKQNLGITHKALNGYYPLCELTANSDINTKSSNKSISYNTKVGVYMQSGYTLSSLEGVKLLSKKYKYYYLNSNAGYSDIQDVLLGKETPNAIQVTENNSDKYKPNFVVCDNKYDNKDMKFFIDANKSEQFHAYIYTLVKSNNKFTSNIFKDNWNNFKGLNNTCSDKLIEDNNDTYMLFGDNPNNINLNNLQSTKLISIPITSDDDSISGYWCGTQRTGNNCIDDIWLSTDTYTNGGTNQNNTLTYSDYLKNYCNKTAIIAKSQSSAQPDLYIPGLLSLTNTLTNLGDISLGSNNVKSPYKFNKSTNYLYLTSTGNPMSMDTQIQICYLNSDMMYAMDTVPLSDFTKLPNGVYELSSNSLGSNCYRMAFAEVYYGFNKDLTSTKFSCSGAISQSKLSGSTLKNLLDGNGMLLTSPKIIYDGKLQDYNLYNYSNLYANSATFNIDAQRSDTCNQSVKLLNPKTGDAIIRNSVTNNSKLFTTIYGIEGLPKTTNIATGMGETSSMGLISTFKRILNQTGGTYYVLPKSDISKYSNLIYSDNTANNVEIKKLIDSGVAVKYTSGMNLSNYGAILFDSGLLKPGKSIDYSFEINVQGIKPNDKQRLYTAFKYFDSTFNQGSISNLNKIDLNIPILYKNSVVIQKTTNGSNPGNTSYKITFKDGRTKIINFSNNGSINLNGNEITKIENMTNNTNWEIKSNVLHSSVDNSTFTKTTTDTITLEPLIQSSVTTEIKCGNNIIGKPVIVKGNFGSVDTAVAPKIPEGYHIVGTSPVIPKLIPNKPVTLTWNIEQDTTTVNPSFVNSKGQEVYGGIIDVYQGKTRMGRINIVKGERNNFEAKGLGTYEVKTEQVPAGYKLDGNIVMTKTTTKDGDVVYNAVQKLTKIPQTSITTQVMLNGQLYNNEKKSVTGYEGSIDNIVAPTIPTGYHLTGTAPSIPKTFQDKDVTLTWNIVEDSSTAKLAFTCDGKDIEGGVFNVNQDNSIFTKIGTSAGKFTDWAVGNINPYTFTVAKVPTGYKLDGTVKTVKTVDKNGDVEYTVIQPLIKIPTITVKTQVMLNGKLYNKEEKIFTGVEGSNSDVTAPSIPSGYHLTGDIPLIGKTFTKDETLTWNIVQDSTTVKVDYETKGGNIVPNGTVKVGDKTITTTNSVSKDVEEGLVSPKIDFAGVPVGYEKVGEPVVKSVTNNGVRVITETQTVKKLPDHSITVEYTDNGKIIGEPTTVSGYQGEVETIKVGKLLDGYHQVGSTPNIPTKIGNSNVIVKIPVVQDTTVIGTAFEDGTSIIKGGTFIIDGKVVNTDINTTEEGITSPEIKVGTLPSGYRLDGSIKLVTSIKDGVKTITAIQQVVKTPDITLTGEVIYNGKVISSDSFTKQLGTSTSGVVVEPKIPTGYTITSSPSIPKTFNHNETLVWKVNKDSTIVNVTFTSDGKDIAEGKVDFISKDGKILKDVISGDTIVTSDLGSSKVSEIKVIAIPSGYIADGKPVIKEITNAGITTITVNQNLTKLNEVTITPEVVCNGKVLVTGNSISGFNGTAAKVVEPKIPNGYHIVSKPNIPTTFGKTDSKVIWTVAPNETIINEQFKTASGSIVNGGSWSKIDSNEISTNTFNGFITPNITVASLPTGYKALGKPSEVITTNKDGNRVIIVTQLVDKIPEGKILTEVKCNNIVIGDINSYSGLSGDSANYQIPTIPKGYKLVNITLNGKVITELPKDFNDDTQTLVWNVVKENPTFTNEIISNVPGAVYRVTYTDGSTQLIKDANVDVKLANKQVKSVDIISNPNNYEQFGKEGSTNITVKGLNTNTQYVFNYNKVPLKYHNVIITECNNGNISGVKYDVTYTNGSSKVFTAGSGSIDSGDSQGVKSVKVLSVPKGYTEISGNLTGGTSDNTDWTTGTFKFSKINYSNAIKQTVEGSKVLPKVIYTVTYQDGKVSVVTDSKDLYALDNSEIKSVEVTSIEKGYELVKASPDVVSGTKTDVKNLFSFEYKKTKSKDTPKHVIIKPSKKANDGDKGSSVDSGSTSSKVSDTTITVKVITNTGKELGKPLVIMGKPGSKDLLVTPTAPAGYKIISITDNGTNVNGVPPEFTDKNQEVVITVGRDNTPVVKHHNAINTATGKGDTGSSIVHHININHEPVGTVVGGITNLGNDVVKGSNPINAELNLPHNSSETVNPKTGDTSNIPYAVGGLAALLALVGINIKRRKVRDKSNN